MVLLEIPTNWQYSNGSWHMHSFTTALSVVSILVAISSCAQEMYSQHGYTALGECPGGYGGAEDLVIDPEQIFETRGIKEGQFVLSSLAPTYEFKILLYSDHMYLWSTEGGLTLGRQESPESPVEFQITRPISRYEHEDEDDLIWDLAFFTPTTLIIQARLGESRGCHVAMIIHHKDKYKDGLRFRIGPGTPITFYWAKHCPEECERFFVPSTD